MTESNSSIEFQEEGNTDTSSFASPKQISPAKRWLFVLNNYTEAEISSIVPILEKMCDFGGFKKEVGDSGTPHLQGYLEFKAKCRPRSLGMCSRIHWGDKWGKSCKKDRATNVTYITKECKYDTSLLDWSVGIPRKPTTIKRENFYEWQEELVQIFEKKCDWDCRKIYWRHGAAGIGKTQFVKWLCVHLGAVVIGGSEKHMYAQAQNADARIYIVLLAYGDDKISYKGIEKIKDGCYTSNFGCDNNKMTIRDSAHCLII